MIGILSTGTGAIQTPKPKPALVSLALAPHVSQRLENAAQLRLLLFDEEHSASSFQNNGLS